MDIKKAVVTVAGQSQRTLPLQTLVDRDGASKTALCIIIEEILQAGLDQICLVIHPGDRAAYAAAAGPHVSRLQFVEQHAPLGYGHASFAPPEADAPATTICFTSRRPNARTGSSR